MTLYKGTDIVFGIPSEWQDRSITAFAAAPQPDKPIAPNIVVTRDVAVDSESVASYADRQMVDMAKRLTNFKLLRRFEGKLGNLPSVELDFVWHGSNGELRQRQFLVIRERVVMTLILTALRSDYPTQEDIFNKILSSVQFP